MLKKKEIVKKRTVKKKVKSTTPELKLAEYGVRSKDSKVQCHLCPHNCVISEGDVGNCRVRKNISGKLYSLVYGKPCSVAIDPVEKKPQYHFLPGSQVFSIGTAGCNLHCKFCQNWEISQVSPDEIHSYDLPPKEVVAQAVESGCESIAYTYNEPTIFLEYIEDCAKIAHKNGLKNIFVTNGFINEQPLLEILPLIDGFHVDLKGFDEKYYKEICFARLEPVLNTLKTLRAHNKWFEIINLVIPGQNDDPAEIRKMCQWIRKELGQDTVLHFSRFFPCYKMSDLPPTPLETLQKAAKIAREEGLRYVYIGNVPGEDNTFCPNCKKVLIRRNNFDIQELNIKESKCKYCQEQIAGVWK